MRPLSRRRHAGWSRPERAGSRTGLAPSLQKGATFRKARSLPQQVAERLFHDLATDFGNRRRQRNIFRTNLDAVLRVATFLDAAVAHERRQTLALQGLPGGMRIEQAHLR